MLEIVLATPSARYEVIEAALLKIKVSGFVFVIWLILLQSYYLLTNQLEKLEAAKAA